MAFSFQKKYNAAHIYLSEYKLVKIGVLQWELNDFMSFSYVFKKRGHKEFKVQYIQFGECPNHFLVKLSPRIESFILTPISIKWFTK